MMNRKIKHNEDFSSYFRKNKRTAPNFLGTIRAFCEKIAIVAAIFTSSIRISAALLVFGALTWHIIGWIAGMILIAQIIHTILQNKISRIVIRFIMTPISLILDIVGYLIAKSTRKTHYYRPITQQIWRQSVINNIYQLEVEELAYIMRSATRRFCGSNCCTYDYNCSRDLDLYFLNLQNTINEMLQQSIKNKSQ